MEAQQHIQNQLVETERLNVNGTRNPREYSWAEKNGLPTPGINISHFYDRAVVYRGSISTVERAKLTVTGKEVILKCYHKAKMSEKHYHKLDREIRCMAALSGPYVASLYTWFSDASSVWLVLEYCEGGDLFRVTADLGGRLNETYTCVEIIAPLLRVLEKCSSLQLLHRDIKPENIFLTRMYKLKLGDWGLATSCAENLPFSRSGTLDYMSPDVLRNPITQLQEGPDVDLAALRKRNIKPYTDKVDVWAVGILAYELVAGKPPFEVESESQTASLIMHCNDIAFPRDSSPLWADFVRCALIKDPVARPSAAELMTHAWITQHLHTAIATAAQQGRKTSKAALLEPLPMPPPSQLLPPGQITHPRPHPASTPSTSTRPATAPQLLQKPGHVRVASAPPSAVITAPPCTTIVSHPIQKFARPAGQHHLVSSVCNSATPQQQHHHMVPSVCNSVTPPQVCNSTTPQQQQQQQATPVPATPGRDAHFSPLHNGAQHGAPHVVCATPTKTQAAHKHSSSWGGSSSAHAESNVLEGLLWQQAQEQQRQEKQQQEQQQQKRLAWGEAALTHTQAVQSVQAAQPGLFKASSSPPPVCTPEPTHSNRALLRAADATPPSHPGASANTNAQGTTAAIPPHAPKACAALDFEQHAHPSARGARVPAPYVQQQQQHLLHGHIHPDGGVATPPVHAHHPSVGGLAAAVNCEQAKWGPELVRNTNSMAVHAHQSSVGGSSNAANSEQSKWGPELVRNTSSNSSNSIGTCQTGPGSSASLTHAQPSFNSMQAFHPSVGGLSAAAHGEQSKWGPELVRNNSSNSNISSTSIGTCQTNAGSSASLTRALPSFNSSANNTRSNTMTRTGSATVGHHSKGSSSWGSMAVEAAASTADALASYMAGLKADADQAILQHYPVLCAPRSEEVDKMMARYTAKP